jgi:hypothetical protein
VIERLIIVDGTVFVEAVPNYLVAVAKVADFLAMTPEARAEAIKLVKITSGKTVQ